MVGKYKVSEYIKTFTDFLKPKKFNLINRDGLYEILICPNCLKEKFKYNKKQLSYICERCNFTLNQIEFQEFAKIEYQKGVLFDFNLGKEPMHKVFDHHGAYNGLVLKTATIEVLDYIKIISRINENSRRVVILSKYREGIKDYIQNNKLNLYVNHLDVDSLLSIFAFRNPNFALEYEEIFTKLSCYADFILLDKEIEQYCLIVHGIIYLLREKGIKDEDIFSFILDNLKSIFIGPENFQEYIIYEKRLIDKDSKLLADSNVEKIFTILPGFHNKVVEFITPKGFKEFVSLFKFLKEHDNGKYNLPFLIKFSSNRLIFSLSVNANVYGFEDIELVHLSNMILDAERQKILSIKIENERKLKEKLDAEEKLKIINRDIQNNYFLNQLHSLRELMVNDRLTEFVDVFGEFIKKEKEIGIDFNEVFLIKELYLRIYKLKKEFIDNIHIQSEDVQINEAMDSINNCRFNDGDSFYRIGKKTLNNNIRPKFSKLFKEVNREKGAIIQKISNLIRVLGGELISQQKEFKRCLRIFKLEVVREDIGNIWIFKSNLIMVNAEYRSNLSYDEFVELIKKNINRVYVK